MKKILFVLLLCTGLGASAQVYNNEWIDHSKTYYKFKVGTSGLYRISAATLQAAGLGGTNALHFQLWRNGREVPIYTSIPSGNFGAGDYIEFWGEQNDGKADKELYRLASYQLNDKWSLQTDTAAFFLTVNPVANNRRLQPVANPVAGNTLPAEPYFMHTVGNYFRNQLNGGYAVDLGEYLYSSSYDKGEGWTSSNIVTNATNRFVFRDLFHYAAGPNATFYMALSGNASKPRRFLTTLNQDSVAGGDIDFFNDRRITTDVPLSVIANDTAHVAVTNKSTYPNDRMVVHKYELTYPRQFNFGGATNFTFRLPPAGSRYLRITNFNRGGVEPVLYDLTNGKRYVGDVSIPGEVRFVIEPAALETDFVLVSEAASNILQVSGLTLRQFINYGLPANQGNYVIITDPRLFGSGGTNPVEEYRQYRASTNGGGFLSKIYLTEDLVDQFAFGIKKHPAGIRNFIRYARNNFSPAVKHVFLVGKAVNYVNYRQFENTSNIESLNLVPTFGNPASDVMLAAEPGSSAPKTSIGRLSVVKPEEVTIYLNKVKEFETHQRTPSPRIADKEWMKNVVHLVGANEPGLQASIDAFMTLYSRIIRDTAFGGRVTTFTKSSPASVQLITNGELNRLFEQGITLMTYFGHSSSSTLEFNLNNPDQYNNPGKYPMFIALGCNAGNNYSYSNIRFSVTETLSEKFVLAPSRGTIGFLASSHFGVTEYLHTYNERLYKAIGQSHYGRPFGEIMNAAIEQVFAYSTQEDMFARSTCEEAAYNGDPALVLNPHPKPDYVLEDANIRINPALVSVADASFTMKIKAVNIGKAISAPVVIRTSREYPNGNTEIIRNDTLQRLPYADSLTIDLIIDPNRDKGLNKITVTIDPGNNIDEIYESNNTVVKEVNIFEDELRPVYPYNYAIVNRQNIKFTAFTADPFAASRNYRFEIDTTELFNSAQKISMDKVSSGGLIEFGPSMTFVHNTVYYWRVAVVGSGPIVKWNTSSFVYMNGSSPGFNQSHYFQHLKSGKSGARMDTLSRRWTFDPIPNELFVRHGTFGLSTGQESGVAITINGVRRANNACQFNSLVFVVFNPSTLAALPNPAGGLYGSGPVCFSGRTYNFEYQYTDTASRRKAMEFMQNNIPDGHYVVVRNFIFGNNETPGQYAPDWRADTAFYGTDRSLYHSLRGAGFLAIDSFNASRPWTFVYKKNDPSFDPKWAIGATKFDNITMSATLNSTGSSGQISSPVFGPAKAWKDFYWSGYSVENPDADQPSVSILGLKNNGVTDTLFRDITPAQQQVSIASIDPVTYPFIKLYLKNSDTLNHTPYQLTGWRVTYDPLPEGSVSPNIAFSMSDSLESGAPAAFKIAFKNISDVAFDSLNVKVTITDRNNVVHPITIPKLKPLGPGDTTLVQFTIDTRNLAGMNTLYVDVNPDNNPQELYHFNNFVYRNLYVYGDTLNPLLDVTFDNQHIINGDIVSAKPLIVINLKDESKFRLLDDTSLVKVQVRYPNGDLRQIFFNSDTLQFVPAQGSNNNNTATVQFRPHFRQDGDYELIVTGKDKSENIAGQLEYRVGFQVIGKPMISNMLNYPNPFTTSTAFVFTITGSEIPQNLKIQILTVTGKVVREITREELGPLRIGRNITEFKWDGTDQFGSRLANGVYLYRVVTNLNGKSLDRYRADGDQTDQYFNKGYGKMYLMR